MMTNSKEKVTAQSREKLVKFWLSSKFTLDLCLSRFQIPTELSAIVQTYSHKQLTNSNIRYAVLLSVSENERERGTSYFWTYFLLAY